MRNSGCYPVKPAARGRVRFDRDRDSGPVVKEENIRLTRRAAETLSNTRARFPSLGSFDRNLKRMESAIQAAMVLCRQVGGTEGYRELMRLEVLLGEIRGEPAARLH